MKRIINGTTYNTDTATRVAEGTWEDENRGITIETTLYQNRGGVFFAVDQVQQNYKDRNEEWQTRETYEWETVGGAAEAVQFCEKHKLTIFHEIADLPPEATAETEQGATVYIRVPVTLKNSVDEAAQTAKLSSNAWAMRCLEKCCGDDDTLQEQLTRIWSLARHITAAPELHSGEQAMKALEEIAGDVERLARDLWDQDDFAKLPGGEGVLLDTVGEFDRTYPAIA